MTDKFLKTIKLALLPAVLLGVFNVNASYYSAPDRGLEDLSPYHESTTYRNLVDRAVNIALSDSEEEKAKASEFLDNFMDKENAYDKITMSLEGESNLDKSSRLTNMRTYWLNLRSVLADVRLENLDVNDKGRQITADPTDYSLDYALDGIIHHVMASVKEYNYSL